MQPYQPQGVVPRPVERPRRRANWWLRLTSWGAGVEFTNLEDRERARRSGLASWLVVGLLAFEALMVPAGATISTTLIAVLVAFVGTILVALFLNKPGYVNAAGIALVVLFCTALVGSLIGAPGSLLDTVYLPAYDLLVIPVVITAIVVRPRWVTWLVVLGNTLIIVLDFALQPKAGGGDLAHWLSIEGPIPLLARPIALQLIVGTAGFLFARSTDDAILRADRAEQIAQLEHQVAEQRRQLEYGVQQLLQTHVRLANGDFSARTPQIQDNYLWQVGQSLNNLIARMQHAVKAEFQLRRVEDELQRLASALDDARMGRPPIWPAPAGTPVDPIVDRLSGRRPAGSPPSVAPPAAPQRAQWSDQLPPRGGYDGYGDNQPSRQGAPRQAGDPYENPWGQR